jgi:hypothetical protein
MIFEQFGQIFDQNLPFFTKSTFFDENWQKSTINIENRLLKFYIKEVFLPIFIFFPHKPQ